MTITPTSGPRKGSATTARTGTKPATRKPAAQAARTRGSRSTTAGVAARSAVMELDAVQKAMSSLQTQSREVWERLVGALASPARPVPDEGFVLQARRNAELRGRLLREWKVLTSAQVADVAGSAAGNRAALATRWRQEGRIFGVPAQGGGGEYVYPSFQFTPDGQPRANLRQLIEAFPAAAREWQLFAWLTNATGWLDGHRPLDRIDDDPGAVLRAAAMEFDASRF